MRFRALLLSALILFPVSSEAIDFGISTFSLNTGYIEHFYRDDPDFPGIYAFYPEVQAGGPFFDPNLQWALSWGRWDDGVERPFTEENITTYSFRGDIFSARIIFRPKNLGENWPLPAGVFAGYSRHLIHAKYVGGEDDYGNTRRNVDRKSNTFEIGLNIEFPAYGPFLFRGEARQFIPFSNDPFKTPQQHRRSYTLGVGFAL